MILIEFILVIGETYATEDLILFIIEMKFIQVHYWMTNLRMGTINEQRQRIGSDAIDNSVI